MALRCNFSSFSSINCGISNYFPDEKEQVYIHECNKDTSSHLNSINISESDIPTEGHLICFRGGIFSCKENFRVCPSHRYSLGLRWRGSTLCHFPGHNGKAKPDRRVNLRMSQWIMAMKGCLLPVGSGICRKCRGQIYDVELPESFYYESSTLENDSQAIDEWICGDMHEHEKSKNTTYNLRKGRESDEQTHNGSECSTQGSSDELANSQGSNWSQEDDMDNLKTFNEAMKHLGKGKISPLKYQVNTPLSDITAQARNYLKRKANEAIHTTLNAIAPGQTAELLNQVVSSTKEPSEVSVDRSLNTLLNLYNSSCDKTVKDQLLSVMAELTTKENVKKLTGASKYEIYKVRSMTLDSLKEKSTEPAKKRQRMDKTKLEHALSFMFDPAFHQLVSYRTTEMRLENGDKIIIPDVIRIACHATIIQLYQSYCAEGFSPLSRTTLFKILRSCAASKRQNLQGLDNITADGLTAFADLEKIVTSLKDRAEIDAHTMQDIKSKLTRSKNYLKSELKFHTYMESDCADHCLQWALSDPKLSCLNTECSHLHDNICSQCESLTNVLEEIQQQKLLADEASNVSIDTKHINNWKAHILRSINQDRSRLDHLESLRENEMLIIMDWAMKLLPHLHREKQSDWFGQKGLSWHVSVCIFKKEDILQHKTMIHVLESGKQDWFAIASILEHLLVTIKCQNPDVEQVYLRSENAGSYHCGHIWASLNSISRRTGIMIKELHYSEAQYGKSYCDAKIAHLRRKIRLYVSEGNNVRLAKEMKAAIDSNGGVTGCQVAVVEVEYCHQTLFTHRFKDVNAISNVNMEEDGMRLFKAYGIGNGVFIQFSEVNKIINACQNETNLKVLIDFEIPSKSVGRIELKRGGEPVELFRCTEEGCIKNFRSYAAFENHTNCERHIYQDSVLSTYDKIKVGRYL